VLFWFHPLTKLLLKAKLNTNNTGSQVPMNLQAPDNFDLHIENYLNSNYSNNAKYLKRQKLGVQKGQKNRFR
jgi:hypothetical protein